MAAPAAIAQNAIAEAAGAVAPRWMTFPYPIAGAYPAKILCLAQAAGPVALFRLPMT